jgi:hypothetical protein
MTAEAGRDRGRRESVGGFDSRPSPQIAFYLGKQAEQAQLTAPFLVPWPWPVLATPICKRWFGGSKATAQRIDGTLE